ncbi:hypothetical protein V6N11_071361 [Hibiscus sabdariffa]|uniref:Uncharacterized protein n=1 Tax=Hibiscus sabdariffa TaxID=183260 RepID=A0ABR2U083_9ROSI
MRPTDNQDTRAIADSGPFATSGAGEEDTHPITDTLPTNPSTTEAECCTRVTPCAPVDSTVLPGVNGVQSPESATSTSSTQNLSTCPMGVSRTPCVETQVSETDARENLPCVDLPCVEAVNGVHGQAYSMDHSTNMSQSVMNGFDPEMVAVYKSLVSEFAVFDRWFASVPSSTQPNRLYVHSATSVGATSNIPSLLVNGYPQRTIFENLDDGGVSWGIYYQNILATLFYKNLRKLKYLFRFRPYGLTFEKHAKEGKLSGYVVVEQRYLDTKLEAANDDHPSHDVYQGQMFVKEVYETLRSSPQWNQTLLIITYDEHGGFFDHVATPVSGVPSPDGIVGPDPFFFKFDRLGVRVPTIMVSPWIDKATVLKITLNRNAADAGENKGRRGEAERVPGRAGGDAEGGSYPEKIGKEMKVKEGKEYIEDAVKRFFEAGRFAKKMGVDADHILQMKPSLTTLLHLNILNLPSFFKHKHL